MLTRSLDIGILMQDNGEYEIAVMEPESGFTASFAYKAGSEYKAATFEDVTEEIRSWIIMLDEERETIKEEEGENE